VLQAMVQDHMGFIGVKLFGQTLMQEGWILI
jgi:hypothetical protein